MKFTNLEFDFHIQRKIILFIVKETCTAIWEVLSSKKIPLLSKEIRLKTAQQFHQVTDFPNYIGAVNGKHIRILCSPSSVLHYFSYKKYRQVLFYAQIMFLKNLHKLKSHKSNTKFRFKTVYFLRVGN
jgi:hypothetical protein